MQERLETLRFALRYQWGELAEHLGLSRSMLDQVRKGQRQLSFKALTRLEQAEQAAGITPAASAAADLSARSAEAFPPAESTPTRMIPVYGIAQCAKSGFKIGDVVPDRIEDLEHVPVPPDLLGIQRLSAFRAEDCSMEPRIREGDLIYFDPDAEIRNGNVCLVKFDHSVACKRYYLHGNAVELRSDHPEVKPITVLAANVEWCYKAVAVVSLRKL